jgi:hypothetical protein
MKSVTERYGVVVCGGGLAGLCAAVSAARQGAKTCIIQDRPVFGGCSSSEIRVPAGGAGNWHVYARETGVISEILEEERARNHQAYFNWNGLAAANSIWDLTLYDLAVTTPNLTIHLNTTVNSVRMAGPREIASVGARTANAEVDLTIEGRIFLDCTGDATVAVLAGCEWRMGSEGRDEFGEPHATPEACDDLMGSSLLFQAVDVGYPAPFTLPEWAVSFDDAAYFYEQGRIIHSVQGGFWWIELGNPWDTITDNEILRHELTRRLLGVWDWIKNKDPKWRDQAANMALDWIGQVPGKRESRRVMGQYFLTEVELLEQRVFPDEVAYGGWFIDLHTRGGMLGESSSPVNALSDNFTAEEGARAFVGPYGLPLRMLISKDVDNLMMAGRNVSQTRAALGTTRLMLTTALMGQAAGTSAAIALRQGIPVASVPETAISEVQQTLLRSGAFLPNARNKDPEDLARNATASASSEALCRGVGPGSRGFYDRMRAAPDAPALARTRGADALRERRGQWIAVATDRIDAIEVCLTNASGVEQEVEAILQPVDTIWDYRVDTGTVLARTTLAVPPGRVQWIEWPLDLAVEPGRYIRLDLLASPEVQWHTAGALEPGHTCAHQVGPDKMRRYEFGWTMSFRISPAQPCYGAANVLSGVARPQGWTNLWRSDPLQSLEQWLELRWPEVQTIAQVELTFPGNLFAPPHRYPPFYREPQCARDYSIKAMVDGQWEAVSRVQDNYRRRRTHTLDTPVTTDRLRVVVHATNGDPSAALYEARCYGPT